MKHLIIQMYCDWPGCMNDWLAEHPEQEQETKAIDFSISSSNTRGRRPKDKAITLCQTHLNELTDLRKTLLKSADPKPRRKVRA